MKKIILSALFTLVSCYSFAQDDVYGTQKRDKNPTSSNLKKSMQLDYDKFEEITRVSHKPYLGNNDFRINCVFIIKNDKPIDLKLRVVYFGKNWLFVNKLTFLIDGKKYSYDVDPTRVVEGGYTVEISEIPAKGIGKEIVDALMSSDKVELRYTGENYYDDAKQLNMDIKRLRRVVEYYKSLGGEI